MKWKKGRSEDVQHLSWSTIDIIAASLVLCCYHVPPPLRLHMSREVRDERGNALMPMHGSSICYCDNTDPDHPIPSRFPEIPTIARFYLSAFLFFFLTSAGPILPSF